MKKISLLISLLFLVSLAISQISCSGTPFKEQIFYQGGPKNIRAIIVYPFLFIGQFKPYQSYEKSMDQIAAIEENGNYLVMGPEEYKSFRYLTYDDTNIFATSNLFIVLSEWGLNPEEVLLIKGLLDRRVATSNVSNTISGNIYTANKISKEITYVLTVQLIYPKTSEILIEERAEIKFDPMASHPDHDPFPQITKINKLMVKRLTEKAEDLMVLKKRKLCLGFKPVNLHTRIFDYTIKEMAPLRKSLKGKSKVEIMTSKLLRYQYFYGNMADKYLWIFDTAKSGVMVQEILPENSLKKHLKKGDIIQKVNGEQVESDYQLIRKINTIKSESPVKLNIIRQGKNHLLELNFPYCQDR